MTKKKSTVSGAAKAGIVAGVVGAVGGVVAGILLAPKSGKETRDDIKKGAKNVKKKVITESAELKKQGEKKVNETIKKSEKAVKRAENTISGAKKGFNKKV